jgi:hypothetical protein
MRKIIAAAVVPLLIPVFCQGQGGPEINIFPPQMHQQICLESTYSRYLDIFNTGNKTLNYNARFSPDTVSWVTAAPLIGEIQPGDTSQIIFNFNSAGLPISNYYIDLIISSNDTANPALDVLTMLHVQILNILINPEQDSICAGCSTLLKTSVFGCSEAYSFNWTSDPPGFISTEKSPVVSPQVNTIYTVTVTDGNYSSQKSVLIKVYGSSWGIYEERLVSGVTVYPNPCDEACLLKFNSGCNGEVFITISDLTGVKLQTERAAIIKGLNEIIVRTGNIDQGVYLISVQVDDKLKRATLLSARIFIL